MVAGRRRCALLAGSAVIAIMTGAGPVLAQQQDDADQATVVLDSIDVQANADAPGSIADTPTATRTTAQDIRDRRINSLQDLGDTTEPGVNFSAATKSINIRGLEDDRVLTVIDGVRVPYMPDYARSAYGGINTFDFTSLATIDIVRGADSSRGGSGMLGGAVILRTLEPGDLMLSGRNWGGFVQTTFDSSDSSVIGSAAYATRVQDTSVLFQGSYKRGNERRTNGDVGGDGLARTRANPLDYDQTNLLFKLRQDLAGGHTIGLSAERYSFDSTSDLFTTYGRDYAVDGNTGIENTRRERVSLDYRFDAPGEGWVDSAEATLYWQRLRRQDGNEGVRITAPVGDYYRLSDNENATIGFTGSALKAFSTGSLHHELTLGIDLASTRTEQYMFGRDSCSVNYVPSCAFHHINQADMPEVDGRRFGIFVDDRIAFGDSGFSLAPGMRYDWYDYTPRASAAWQDNSGYIDLPPARDGSRFSPRLRAAYEVTPSVEFYAQWSMGFRAPNVSELYHHYAKTSGFPTYEVLGNPDLRPEKSNGIEVGVNFGDQYFGGHVGAFHNRYRDFIDTIQLATPNPGYMITQQAVNIDRVEISGFEARAHKLFSNGFHIRGSLAYARGRNLDTGEYLASVAPMKAVAAIGYSAEHWGVDLSAIGVAAVSENSNAVFKAPGYGIVNIGGWWEPEQIEGLRISAAVHNLFDKTYYDALGRRSVDLNSPTAQPAAFYSEPGRSFRLSITKQF